MNLEKKHELSNKGSWVRIISIATGLQSLKNESWVYSQQKRTIPIGYVDLGAYYSMGAGDKAAEV
jgi:hypothetical protein